MNDVQEVIQTIERSEEFAAFRSVHPLPYLVHVFSSVRDGALAIEAGYYDAQEDTITVFTYEPVRAREPEGIFKEGGALVALDISRVTLDLAQARSRAADLLRNAHAGHEPAQEICILQHQDGPVWNITLVTSRFAMFNVKIDAISGIVRSTDMRSLLDLRSEE